MRGLLMAVILLLISTVSFAAPMDLMPLVPLAAVIVAIFIALMFMLSEAIVNPHLHAWAKTELRELFAGVILVVIIYTVFISPIGLKPLTKTITGQDDYITASVSILDNSITDSTYGYDVAYENLIRVATKLRIGSSYSPYLTIPIWYFSLMYYTAPLSGMSIFLGALASATQGVSNVIFLYEGLILLIKFFASTVPVILLPIAFILRLLPPTRKTGNTIIALSLAAIVVLPLSVIIVGEMNKAIERPKVTVENMDKLNSKAWAMLTAGIFCQFKPMRAMWGMNEYAFAALVCLPLLAIFPLGPSLFAACFSTISQLVYPLVTEIIKLVQLVLLLQWLSWAEVAVGQYGGFDPAGKGWPAQSFPVLMDFLANVNNAVLVGYINTLVITIITISGARSISTALGGDWYLAGVERLI